MEILCDKSTLVIKLLKVQIELKSFGFFFNVNVNLMGFFNFRKHSLGFEHNLQNSHHATCLTWLLTCTLGVPNFCKIVVLENSVNVVNNKDNKTVQSVAYPFNLWNPTKLEFTRYL